MRGNELLLLRRPQAYEHSVRAATGIDGLDRFLFIGKTAVVRSCKDQPGVFYAEVSARLFCHARLCAEQVKAHSFLCHGSGKAFGKIYAGDLAAQLLAQDFCGIDDADAIRQYQGGMIHHPHKIAVLSAKIHYFRIWRHHIPLLPRADPAHGQLHRLLQRYGMKMHAQN